MEKELITRVSAIYLRVCFSCGPFNIQSNYSRPWGDVCWKKRKATESNACAPDLVLYVGADYPQWQPGELRRINLNQSRVPDLVGEISDTFLANDLDEQKHLYASLGIPEYWVVDVRGQRVFPFLLRDDGEYKLCEESRTLTGLSIALLEQVIQKLQEGTNASAAAWFAQQISQ